MLSGLLFRSVQCAASGSSARQVSGPCARTLSRCVCARQINQASATHVSCGSKRQWTGRQHPPSRNPVTGNNTTPRASTPRQPHPFRPYGQQPQALPSCHTHVHHTQVRETHPFEDFVQVFETALELRVVRGVSKPVALTLWCLERGKCLEVAPQVRPGYLEDVRLVPLGF